MHDLRNTASTKIIAQENENIRMEKGVEALRKYVKIKENSQLSHDMRVNGDLQREGESIENLRSNKY